MDKIQLSKKTVKELNQFMKGNELNNYDHQKDNLRIRLDFPKQDTPDNPYFHPTAAKFIIGCIVMIVMYIFTPTWTDDLYILQNWMVALYIGEFIAFFFIGYIIYTTKIRKNRWISVLETTEKRKSYTDSKHIKDVPK